ncbi:MULTISPECIES: hypothetical protein [Streptomyces]|uniref:hypothetical protein n=1 Tax=Streptomyces TaxID=1883 RepID=UPI000CD56D2D|nr:MULTISPECIES: hypothetical protein [Streptomyces]
MTEPGQDMTHNPLNITIEYPEPWIEFPLAPDADVAAWAEDRAARIVRSAAGDEVPEVTRMLHPSQEELAAELRTRAEAYRGQDLVFALGCYPPGIDSSDVGLEVGYVFPEPGDPPLTLEWFAERNTVRELGEPDVQYGELPNVGRAVRLRQNYPGARKSWFGGRTVNRSVVYGIAPRGQDSLITLTALWTDPGIDEPVEEWTDEIAGTVMADPAG